jgi:hypothetical protein
MLVLQILKIDVKAGLSRKTGNAYRLAEATGVVKTQKEDGSEDWAVGRFLLPKGSEELKAGHYSVDFTFVSGQDGELSPRIRSLRPAVLQGAKS